MGPPASNPYSVGTLQRLEDDMDHRLVLSALGQVDVHDPDTQRIKCLDVEYVLIYAQLFVMFRHDDLCLYHMIYILGIPGCTTTKEQANQNGH